MVLCLFYGVYQLLLLCSISNYNYEWEGSGYSLFEGTIPAFTWTDWQIWYIPSYTISLIIK
jgi:hypothetical protein